MMSGATDDARRAAEAREVSLTFLTQDEASQVLRVSKRTLERHRVTGTGPVFVKLGRRVVYRAHDLLAWTDSQTFRSTSEFLRG